MREEKAKLVPVCSCLQECGEDRATLLRGASGKTGGNGPQLEHWKFFLNMRGRSFYRDSRQPLEPKPGEAVESLTLDTHSNSLGEV